MRRSGLRVPKSRFSSRRTRGNSSVRISAPLEYSAVDRRVACATTKISRQRDLHVVERRRRTERDRGHDHSRRANAALRAYFIHEESLQRMIVPQTLDRHYVRAFDLRYRDQARADGLSVHQNGAGTALALAAPLLRSR